jgi:hypothetical protein
MKAIAIIFAALALFALAACKDVPGADGRYAVHDGGNRHGSP